MRFTRPGASARRGAAPPNTSWKRRAASCRGSVMGMGTLLGFGTGGGGAVVDLVLLAQARRRVLGREVALRLGGQLVADQEFPHRGRAQQRGKEDGVQPPPGVVAHGGLPVPAHRV